MDLNKTKLEATEMVKKELSKSQPAPQNSFIVLGDAYIKSELPRNENSRLDEILGTLDDMFAKVDTMEAMMDDIRSPIQRVRPCAPQCSTGAAPKMVKTIGNCQKYSQPHFDFDACSESYQ